MDGDYRLLVFDWDGTLMDSEAEIVACMQAAAADLGLAPLAAEPVRDIIGLGLREAVDALFPGRDGAFLEAFVERYRHYWLAAEQSPALFPGAAETVRLLRDEGFLLAVATGKGRRGLDRALADTGLGGLFHATRCSDETRSKPHPMMLEQLMDELGVTPADTLMIGDTEYDMEMARNAGTGALAVAYGVHTPERLQRHAPLACLERITELNDWIAEQRVRAAS